MRVFLSTADASGDLHAAALVAALRRRLAEQGEPLEVFGLGGQALQAEGLRPLAEQSDLAVGGLFEVASSLPRVIRSYAALRRGIREERPDLVLLVDTPDLNLPLAGVARRAKCPVLYYIAPQVWAWRSGRIRQLRERVTHMGVIFPFEAGLFNQSGVPATFVGHPLVDRMAQVEAELKPKEVAAELNIDPSKRLLGLLPGSRRNEIAANLDRMLETAELLLAEFPGLQVRLLVAPTLEPIERPLPAGIEWVRGMTHEAMAISTALLAAPGTVTVEAALLRTPMIVTHEINSFSFAIFQRLARVPSSCMVNLIADEGSCQNACSNWPDPLHWPPNCRVCCAIPSRARISARPSPRRPPSSGDLAPRSALRR